MKLVMIHNDRRMHTPLSEGRQVLGRGKDADIQISDPAISRHHVELTLAGESLSIKDLGSRNGFKSGGRRQENATLSHNESFSIGDITFVFQARDDEVPGAAAPRETDGTPMDAEFIPTAGSAQAPEPPRALPVAVVPAPAAAKAPQRLNPRLLLAAIPLVLILVAALVKMGGSGSSGTPVVPPPQPAEREWSLEDYQSSCEEIAAVFAEYFSDPSRHFSRLAEAQKAVEKPLNHPKFRRQDLAESLATILTAFGKAGHEWGRLDLLQLTAIQDAAAKLESSRHTTKKLKLAGQELLAWTEKQMGAANSLEGVRELKVSGDLEKLEQAYRQVSSLPSDHIYVEAQAGLKSELYRQVGDGYLKKGQAALDRGDAAGAKEALGRARDYGRADEATKILEGIDTSERNADLFAQAEKALEKDDLTVAAELLARMQSAPDWDARISTLRQNVERRSLVLQMRQAFTRGEIEKVESLAKGNPQETHPQVQKLLTDFRSLVASLHSGKAKLGAGDYEGAKSDLTRVSEGILDDTNAYKVEASTLLADMDPKKLASKHLALAQAFLALNPPQLSKARAELDIAQGFDKKAGSLEVKEIVRIVGERLSVYHKARASGDEKAVEAAKEGLKDAQAALRANPSASPDTEGSLIQLIKNLIR